nr:elongation factor 1-alpha [Aglaonema commutatum]
MPRKVSYGLDCDDEYGDYDDYDDYDYDYDVDDAGKTSHIALSHQVKKSGLWRCSICTYDNDESLSFCDICGVIRESFANLAISGKEKVDAVDKIYGASIMAKSLFSSIPSGGPKAAPAFQQLNEESLNIKENDFRGNINLQGCFDDPQAFLAPDSNAHKNIASFKFDSPSPDDIVSSGKNASRVAQKARATSVITRSKDVAEDLPIAKVLECSSGITFKDRQHNVNESSSAVDSDVRSKIPASNLQDLDSYKNSGSQKKIMNRDMSVSAQYKPEKWMLPDQEQGALVQLNLAIVGHVDSGKSTLSGRLLHQLGRISQKEMHKYEKEAKEKGKGSFAYAWAMDESAEERERGITMTVAVAYFDTQKYHIVLLDSPGHKDFVPNLISGATQADAAILVIDSSIGSFEAGMEGGGQTREHAQLVRSFGVEQVIVAVNKMDTVEYSKERFDSIKVQLGLFLRTCGFKESSILWIPLSAIENQNLVKAAADARLSCWYDGPSLLDAINSLQPPLRDVSKPLRLPICDVIKSRSVGHVSASGKLETGAIRNGTKVLVMPSGDTATVRSIERDSCICSVARAGDNVAVVLQGIDTGNVMSGSVLCHPEFPVPVATCLELKILLLDVATPILVGSEVEFHIHHVREAARVAKISSVIDPKTGKVSKKAARFLSAKQSAVIEVDLDGAVCVEEFSKCRALGRVFLRASGNTVAVGIVTRVIQQE